MLDHLIPMEDEDASKELERAFKKRKHRRPPRRAGDADRGLGRAPSPLHFEGKDGASGERRGRPRAGRDRPRPAACATSASRPPASSSTRAAGSSSTATCARTSPTSTPSGDVAGVYQLAHTSFREGEIAAENALGHDADDRLLGRPAVRLHRPRGRGRRPHRGAGARAARRRRRDRPIPVLGVARARRCTASGPGFAKTIHETRYGELLGLVIVGTQATELVNAGVVGITAEATIDTIADSIAAHPTLAEAVKEAALVALDGRSTCRRRVRGRRPRLGEPQRRRLEYLIPTLKDDPADAEAISHQLLVRAGFVRQVGSGLYTYLPLGWRVLKKRDAEIIREEMDTHRRAEMLMPVLQPAELWQSDRGATTSTCSSSSRTAPARSLRARDHPRGDRHAATPPETIRSYRELPQIWYHHPDQGARRAAARRAASCARASSS